MDTWFGAITIVVMILIPAYLIWMLIRSIQHERRASNVRRIWTNFGLGIVLCVLFFVSWGAHAAAQWRTFVNEQQQHNQPAEAGEFMVDFGKSTFENWQSEFLQLFSFVVLAALYTHRGSAESKDSDDRMEAKLDRIVEKLDA